MSFRLIPGPVRYSSTGIAARHRTIALALVARRIDSGFRGDSGGRVAASAAAVCRRPGFDQHQRQQPDRHATGLHARRDRLEQLLDRQAVMFQNGSGATLNRVTGGSLSAILLSATGDVYLINPQGIVVTSW